MNLLEFTLSGGKSASNEKGSKIPWNDPDFSRRMLENHLSQEHDWASRRASLIVRHTDWLAGQLRQTPSRVLDLGGGPGFYTHALAKQGHHCVGVDFSPASIAYARQQAADSGLEIDYVLGDIRSYANDRAFDCILMTFGEFNVFTRQDAHDVVKNCTAMLADNGFLLLEAHTYEAVRASGEAAPSWQRQTSGLFSDNPHLCLQENSWNETDATALSRYFVIDSISAAVRHYASFMQAYTDAEYGDMLQSVGLASRQILDADTWPAGEEFQGKLRVFVAGHECSRQNIR